MIPRGTKKEEGIAMIRKCHMCTNEPNYNTRYDGDFSVFIKGIKVKIEKMYRDGSMPCYVVFT